MASLVRLQSEISITPASWPAIESRLQSMDPNKRSNYTLRLRMLRIDQNGYDERSMFTEDSILAISEWVRDMENLIAVEYRVRGVCPRHSQLACALLHKQVRRFEFEVDPLLDDNMDDWQRVLYGTAETLEYLVVNVRQMPQTPQETVPPFPRLRCLSYGNDSEEEDNVLPFYLLSVVKNAPQLRSLILNVYANMMATRHLVQQYGTKLRTLTCLRRWTLRRLSASLWQDICPNVTKLVIEDHLDQGVLMLVGEAFSGLRCLQLRHQRVGHSYSYAEFLSNREVLPRLSHIRLTGKLEDVSVIMGRRPRLDREACQILADVEEAHLDHLQAVARSRRIMLEIYTTTA